VVVLRVDAQQFCVFRLLFDLDIEGGQGFAALAFAAPLDLCRPALGGVR